MNSNSLGDFKWTSVGKVLLILGIAAAGVSIVIGVRNGWMPVDFQWQASRDLWTGRNPYVNDLASDGVMACYPPSCLLFIGLWAAIPDPVCATRVWHACNLLFTFVFLSGLFRLLDFRMSRKQMAWFAIALICSVPWRVHQGCGQHALFSLMFFVWSLVLSKWGHWMTAGIALALSLFKYSLTGPLALIFMCQRQWRPLAVAGSVHLACSLFANGLTWENPVSLILSSLKVGTGLEGEGCADLASLACFLGGTRQMVHVFALIGYAVLGVTAGCLAALHVHRGMAFSGRELLRNLSLLSVLTLLTTYHRHYDVLLLVFPMAYLLTASSRIVKAVIVINLLWAFYVCRVAFSFAPAFNSPLVFFPLAVILLGALSLEKVGNMRSKLSHAHDLVPQSQGGVDLAAQVFRS